MSNDIRITDLHVASAGSGWLMIPLNFDRHGAAKSEAIRQTEQMWGVDRPILYHDCGKYKRFAVHVWLSGVASPAEIDADGSHLIVIWLADEIPTDFLGDALKLIDSHGGWDKHSKGWWL